MSRLRLSPRTYQRITLVAAILVATIIVTGAAVRLTNSGLGCPSWPNCSKGRLTPHDASSYHAMVEFVNRTFTGAVSLGVIAAVLGSLLRVPRRRDLTWLSIGLVLGVIGQIVLGGITVLVDLHPVAVMSHYLLSILLLADAIVLVHRAGLPDDGVTRRTVSPRVRGAAVTLLVAASLVLVTGTIVTNSGPHAGDAKAKRFDFYLTDVARVHGSTVMLFLGLTIVTLWVANRDRVPARTIRDLTILLVAIVVQAGIGYTQYFTGVPAWLVELHVAGSVVVFTATLLLLLHTTERVAVGATPAPAPSAPGTPLLSGT